MGFSHSPSSSPSSDSCIDIVGSGQGIKGVVLVLVEVLVDVLLGVLVEDLPGVLDLADVLLPVVVLAPAAALLLSTPLHTAQLLSPSLPSMYGCS